jgi:hypothetical protein
MNGSTTSRIMTTFSEGRMEGMACLKPQTPIAGSCPWLNLGYIPYNLYITPLLDRVDISLSTVRVNRTLLNTHNSINRQPLRQEVRANLTPTVPSTREVLQPGKDPVRNNARYPLQFGFGPEAYIGDLDMTH